MNNVNFTVHDPDYRIKISVIPFEELINSVERYNFQDFDLFGTEMESFELSLKDVTGTSKKLMLLKDNNLIGHNVDLGEISEDYFFLFESATSLILSHIDPYLSSGISDAKAAIRANIFM